MYNPTFGSLTNANSNYFVFTPRQVQLALRYTFYESPFALDRLPGAHRPGLFVRTAMIAEIETYQDQLLSITQDVPGLIGRLSDEQFNWRPAANRWSMAECFDHLNVSPRVHPCH